MARAVLGLKATPGRIAIFNATYGLNKPLYEQFGAYVDQVVHGNLGTSYQLQQPVSTLIAQRLPRDAAAARAVDRAGPAHRAADGHLPGGSAQRAGRRHCSPGPAFTLYSVPDFLVAFMLIAVLVRAVPRLPARGVPAARLGRAAAGRPAGAGPAGGGADPIQRGRVQPVHAGVGASRHWPRTTSGWPGPRACRERLVLSAGTCCATRCCRSSPSSACRCPDIVAGAVIAEEVFNFPGMGLLFWQAALSHDFPVLLGATLIVGDGHRDREPAGRHRLRRPGPEDPAWLVRCRRRPRPSPAAIAGRRPGQRAGRRGGRLSPAEFVHDKRGRERRGAGRRSCACSASSARSSTRPTRSSFT